MMKKKHKPQFHVPNFGAPNRKRVTDKWKSQRGIDNKMRTKKAKMGPTPSIGYKNSETIRYARPDGTFEFIVHNEKELISVSSMPGYSAKFAHDLSSRKRAALQKIADQKSIRILNRL
ncbi:MAG: hypothetical protein KGH64_06365 [Candidatus Micrarchaeota archaeon]|nr:hypothetical protein [Candidatus Micrarchaeota archaeon]MDE1834930.1 hypothetical protein [Candidatus Micrarchaeota archaeon]MDE1859253.1 hypothetical protein [Candidatus Micrarchaeota archaeon]